MSPEMVGNDEGDVHCSICGRRDWWRAVRFFTPDETGEEIMVIVCESRYDGQSCIDRIKEAGA